MASVGERIGSGLDACGTREGVTREYGITGKGNKAV